LYFADYILRLNL